MENLTSSYWTILFIIDFILFLATAITVLYFLVFSIASLITKRFETPRAKKQNRFIVIVPSYKGDKSIESTVKSILAQGYPQRMFDVIVVSDHMDEMTNIRLAQYPITLLVPNFKYSTKAKSLQFAMANLPEFKVYDTVLILDADNVIENDFLERVNDAYDTSGTQAIQLRRVSKNRDTAVANLEAIFEEINNSVFRQGHINMGMSAALAGSGMVFSFSWFKDNVKKLKTAWEDKELEALLLQQHIYIDYFQDIFVFDEKQRDVESFNNQRSRYATTQMYTFVRNVKNFFPALFSKRYDYVDKILQWTLIPRTMLLAIIAFMSVILPFIYMTLAIKWWIAGAVIMFAFALACPDYLVDEKFDKSFLKAPVIMLLSFLNIFRIGPGKNRYVNKNKNNNFYK